jgi:hypothetical protein
MLIELSSSAGLLWCKTHYSPKSSSWAAPRTLSLFKGLHIIMRKYENGRMLFNPLFDCTNIHNIVHQEHSLRLSSNYSIAIKLHPLVTIQWLVPRPITSTLLLGGRCGTSDSLSLPALELVLS